MTIKQQGGIFGRNPSYNEVGANELTVDNIKIDGNAITSTDTNGDIGLNPNGTGSLLIGNNGQDNYVAAKIRKKFNGTVAVQFDGGGDAIYADLKMDATENLRLRLDPDSSISDTSFFIQHHGDQIAKFDGATNDVTVVNGNLIIGTSGKGIDFSATSGTGTSELFDDYEEGDFTVTDASGAGLTFTQEHGFYTKVGRLVHCHIFVQYPSTANGSNAKLGGLPFTSASLGSSMGGAWGYTNGTGAVSFTIGQGATDIGINNSSGGNLTNANMSGSYNYITVTYQAA